MLRYITIIALALIAVTTGFEAYSQTNDAFESGYGALEVFDGSGMSSMPLWVKLWLGVLVLTFASSLIFVRNHLTAQLAIAGFVLSIIATSVIFRALGLPFLSGSISIGHIVFWSPALFLLLLRRPFLDASKGQLYRIWSGMMTAVILFSFVFDIDYAVSYIMHLSA